MSEESLTIEYRGKQYAGRRSITGSRKMFQAIYYGGRSKADGHPYKTGEETYMRLIAGIILRELAEEDSRGI